MKSHIQGTRFIKNVSELSLSDVLSAELLTTITHLGGIMVMHHIHHKHKYTGQLFNWIQMHDITSLGKQIFAYEY